MNQKNNQYVETTTTLITVCVCTYKRPQFLQRLLENLFDQKSDNIFTYSIVVVDNDFERSAETIVSCFKNKTKQPVNYFNEPRQSISHARNKAVEKATGDFIAFIDDDEFPENTWLLNLYKTLIAYKADGVMGPVIPHFETQPPQWVIRSRLLERRRFVTGTVLKPGDMRTGNVLLAKRIFSDDQTPFDPRFGRTGGEDSYFFRRMYAKGYTFVWCDEAQAYETVPPERYKRGYFLKRALLRGVGEAHSGSTTAIDAFKSLTAFILYTLALPSLFLAGHHLFMKYLVKDCDHIGKLLALCGIDVLKQRDF